MKLTYVMKFVSNIDDAVTFYRDTLELPLKSQSPGWSEFATGSTVLAVHPSSERNPPGTVELGFSVDDLQAFHAAMTAKGRVAPYLRGIEPLGLSSPGQRENQGDPLMDTLRRELAVIPTKL
jgi:lactoylglutathione lyase